MFIKLNACDELYKDSLKAKTKDPLWFLAKQWQTGEFLAESCGHPVTSELRYAELPVTSVAHGDGQTEPYDANYPVEMYIEKEEETGAPPDWDTAKLEYRADLLGAGFKLTADGYYSGNLEWYDYVIKDTGARFDDVKTVIMEPGNISYSGMPSARFWKADESTINFRQIERLSENVLITMLLDFAMLYGEDWYMFPLEQKVGTLRKVLGVWIKDSFDDRYTLPAVQNMQNALDQWSMFSMTKANSSLPDNSVFFLPNTINQLLEGPPVEEVSFVRDEMMNLVWAVENKYEKDGRVVNRNDEREGADRPPIIYDKDKTPVYIETAEAPENWTPYFPVMLSGSQRVALLRGRTRLSETGPLDSFKGKLIGESKSFYQEEVSSLTVSLRRKYKLLNNGRAENWSLAQNGQNGMIYVKSSSDVNELLLWRAREKKPAEKAPLQLFLFDTVVSGE